MATDLIDEVVFTEPVTVPDDGDDRDAASVLAAFQALANRTRALRTVLDNFGLIARTWPAVQTFNSPIVAEGGIMLPPGAEVLYSDADGDPSTRTRTIRRALVGHFGADDLDGRRANEARGGMSFGFEAGQSAADWIEPVILPAGATLTGWRAFARRNTLGVAGTAGDFAGVLEQIADPIGYFPSATAVGAPDVIASGSGVASKVLEQSGLSAVIDGASIYRVRFTIPSTTGSSNGMLHYLSALELTFLEPRGSGHH